MLSVDLCSSGLRSKITCVRNEDHRKSDEHIVSPPHLRCGLGRRLASAGHFAHARERWCDRALSLDVVSLLGQLPPLACAGGAFCCPPVVDGIHNI